MAYPKKDEMPVGAKTYIEELVDSIVFNYYEDIDTKEMRKGNLVEDDSIDLYNNVFFTNHEKADKPAENDYLKTLTCDIDDEPTDTVKDIKSSWSKKSFPKTVAKATDKAKKAGYPYQIQGYMSIYGRSKGEIAFCLTDTPEGLCEWENSSMHCMDDIDDEFKVTRVEYEHNEELEKQIYQRVVLCRFYACKYYRQILEDHGH